MIKIPNKTILETNTNCSLSDIFFRFAYRNMFKYRKDKNKLKVSNLQKAFLKKVNKQ